MENSTSQIKGGGIYSFSQNFALAMIDSQIDTASSASGGFIYADFS